MILENIQNGHPGPSWGILGHPGPFWAILGHPGPPWAILQNDVGNPRQESVQIISKMTSGAFPTHIQNDVGNPRREPSKMMSGTHAVNPPKSHLK